MNFNHISIILKKELVDMFRDKKTIISSILIPIIIFPLIYGFMGLSQKNISKGIEEHGVDIALVSESKDSSIVDFFKNDSEFNIIETKNPQKSLEEGDIKALINISENFDDNISKDKVASITVNYDDSNQTSIMAMSIIRETISKYSASIVSNKLKDRGIDPSILNPINIKEEGIAQEGGTGAMIFSMLFPLMLSLPSATDNGAGEKERGTLEPLLTTQVNRTSLFIGKYLAITISGIIGTFSSILGLFIAQRFNTELLGEGVNFTFLSIIMISLSAICLTLIFSALELAISIYARSFKEAQTYLSPLSIVVMIPAFATYMIDPKSISTTYFNIPIVSQISIMKELIVGIYNPVHIALSFSWAIIYIILATIFARKMFENESVIFRV
jgi:sodium transport system permease protein